MLKRVINAGYHLATSYTRGCIFREIASMHKVLFILVSILFLVACQQAPQETSINEPEGAVVSTPEPSTETAQRLVYPETKTVDVVDNYHGTEVSDHFRWLEDDVRESTEVEAWVNAQNTVTNAYLDNLPNRAAIEERLTELWNYERFSVPFTEGGRIFYSRNDGLQNQSVLYVQDKALSEPRMLIDPNSWSGDGTVALGSVVPSPDGKYLAYAIQDGGSDWRTWKVMDIDSGEILDDELVWLKFTSVSWARDGSGFYYSRYPKPEQGQEMQSLNVNQKVYWHGLGTNQSQDAVIYETPDHPEWGYQSEVTEDGRYLIIATWVGTDNRNRITVKDLSDNTTTELIDNFEFDYSFIANEGSKLFFFSNNNAPKNRVIAIDLKNPGPGNWEEVIPELEHVMANANFVGGRFITEYLEDAKSAVRLYMADGQAAGSVDLPGIGSAGGFFGGAHDTHTYFAFSSFNAPPAIYRYDIDSGERTLFRGAQVDFSPDDYVVEQVFYHSKDGTRVPLFIAHKKGLELKGDLPTLLYAYGGFNISLAPSFSVRWLSWMEMGGVFALANIRGGGEYGRDWHQAGTKLQKQNVFDDFIAAGEYLIDEGYTKPSKLAVMGGSNGGLLVGAVVNQRPDLFGAALPMVGVMDMLRFHRFTAGRFWTDDYGSADNPDEFEALYAYSPYHNIKDGTAYPAVLVTTADRDDRVVPGHSFKYAARLQQAHSGEAPVMIRIETRAGHGGGTSTDKAIELLSDQYAFLSANLEMSPKQ